MITIRLQFDVSNICYNFCREPWPLAKTSGSWTCPRSARSPAGFMPANNLSQKSTLHWDCWLPVSRFGDGEKSKKCFAAFGIRLKNEGVRKRSQLGRSQSSAVVVVCASGGVLLWRSVMCVCRVKGEEDHYMEYGGRGPVAKK